MELKLLSVLLVSRGSVIIAIFMLPILIVPGKKYFAGNYGFTLKKIESIVVVVVKSSKMFKALPIELES